MKGSASLLGHNSHFVTFAKSQIDYLHHETHYTSSLQFLSVPLHVRNKDAHFIAHKRTSTFCPSPSFFLSFFRSSVSLPISMHKSPIIWSSLWSVSLAHMYFIHFPKTYVVMSVIKTNDHIISSRFSQGFIITCRSMFTSFHFIKIQVDTAAFYLFKKKYIYF